MSALREIFARFSIEMDTAPIDQGESRLDSMVGSLNTFGQAVAANFAYQYVREFVVEIQNAGDAIGDLSAVMGISGAELQQWRYVAQLAGVDAGEFDGAFLRLQNRMAQGGAGAAVFRQLGVEIRNADGSLRNASDVLTDLADPIAAIGSDTERTGVLVDLLGRSGARLGPLFTQGSEGIARVRGEFEALGGGLSEEAIDDAGRLGDAWDRLSVVTTTLRSRLAVFLLPALETVSNLMVRASQTTSIIEASLGLVVIALGRTAIASAATWGPMALNAARALFPLLVIGIALEDIITLFRGGDSVIGRFMDALGGDGTQEQFVAYMTEAWEGFLLTVHDTIPLLQEALQGFALTVHDIGSLLGEAFDGMVLTVTDLSALLSEALDGALLTVTDLADMLSPITDALGVTGETSVGGITAGGETRSGVRGMVQGAAGKRTPGGVTVTSAPSISIDARGMDPAAIQSIVQRALANAAAASNQETLDALAGGGIE